MKPRIVLALCVTLGGAAATVSARAAETIFVWPDLAPGETERSPGTMLPMRPVDNPPITRVEKISQPPMKVFLPTAEPNGVAVLILPGGGFGRVVPDLEGSEAADWLAALGVTSFVLNYRTNERNLADEPAWRRPLQDSQRAMRWIRAHAAKWKVDPQRVGLLAFSAGGQVGSMLITAADQAAYARIDDLDDQSFRPDFAMLVYPWRIYDAQTDGLLPQIKVTADTPPSFIVHTDDDQSTSLGAALLYAALKRSDVPAELHVYETGGHGYGTRDRPGSNIGTWTDRATDWLRRRLP
jgi:acetyl esterase/lipase